VDRLSAPEQNRLLAGLSNLLRRVEQDSGPEFLPRGLDVMGLVRQLALPSAETVEKLSYGDPLFRMPQQSNIPITTDRGYVAEVLGMAPAVPAASRATTRISNEMADQLVRAITGNPQATAPAALEAAGQMAPLARMFKPEEVKKVIPETKVVDESGNPQLMYHGTREDFNEFSPGARGAVFATPDPNFTKMYAGETLGSYVEGGNVRPVYIDAKNPFDYENPKHISSVVKWIKENNPDFQDIAESIGDKVKDGFYYTIERPVVQDAIRNLGFDGFYVNEGNVKNIAVFDPRQIKSATSDPAFAGLLEPEAAATSKKTALSDTKVVDDSGNPMVMYHGTQRAPMGIDEFRSESGYAGQETAGISWFTSSPESASGYANWVEGAGNPTVYPVYLSIKNPASIDDYLKAVDEINKSVKGRNFVDNDPEIGMYDKRVVEKLKDKGFDGVSWTDAEYTGQTGFPTDKDVTALPFSSKQIKSAISDPSFNGLLNE